MEKILQQEAKKLAELLPQKGIMLATAESCTGGLIAKSMTDVAGSSAWFSRSLVTYTNTSKMELLGVNKDTLVEHGAVSEQTVIEMVSGLFKYDEVGIGVAISGIAGPGGGSDDKPVGTVWIAWKQQDQAVETQLFNFSGDRETIRMKGALAAVKGLIERL